MTRNTRFSDAGSRIAPAVWLDYIDYGNVNVADHVDHTAMYIQSHEPLEYQQKKTDNLPEVGKLQ